jgi:ribosomal protein S6--L-glutamate ligase
MRIGVIVEPRYLRQEMPGGLIRVLRARGVVVDLLIPRDGRFDTADGVLWTDGSASAPLGTYDVVLSRNRGGLGLAMLAWAEAAGIRTLNSYRSTQRVRNKAEMGIELEHAGVPCAPTVLADSSAVLAELPPEWFPLILKPTYGDNSQGLRLVRHPEGLADIHWHGDFVLAQHYLENDGFDLKLYVCGERVWAVQKPSPFNGDPRATARRIEPDQGMVALAHGCGRTFGLEIYGVDAIQTAEGPRVLEVNEFPNFTGLGDAAERLADYVLAAEPAAIGGAA